MNSLHFFPLSDMAYVIKKRNVERQAQVISDLIIDNYVDNQPGYIVVEEEVLSGVKLLASPVQTTDAVKGFIRDHCVFGPGYRVKNKDLYEEFTKIYNESKISRIRFHAAFREQCPNLQQKCVTQSEKGYVGVILRQDYINLQSNE